MLISKKYKKENVKLKTIVYKEIIFNITINYRIIIDY